MSVEMQKYEDRPFTLAMAAAYLSKTESAISSLVHRKEVKHYKPHPQTLYFKKADLDAYAFSNPVMTSKEANEKAEKILNKEATV